MKLLPSARAVGRGRMLSLALAFESMFALSPLAIGADPAGGVSASPLELGTRWELFVDNFLVANTRGAALKLHEPRRAEVVLVLDAPWEGPTSAYFAVLKDGDVIRLYYRGSVAGSDHSDNQVTCVAESRDGIHFTRPKLGLIEVNGSKDNNVVWRGVESHNFAPFLDTNPKATPDARYKALAGLKQPGRNWHQGETPGGLYAFASPDGINWRKIRPEPVMTKGAFDSLNLAFWDPTRDRYTCYSRIFENKVRAVQSVPSADFVTWGDPVSNRYAKDVPYEHFYTSSTVPCPGAEHLLVAFPKRFVTNRKKVPEHSGPGVSDAVFMTSRDGQFWDRTFLEAWVRPGPDQKNWTDRNNMPAWGIVESAPGEWSMYISEHYRWPDCRIRRLTLPRHRFAAMNAGAAGGEFTTHPLVIGGSRLVLNYATSAAGSVEIELQDAAGKPLPGFAAADMPPLFGDELDATAKWKQGSSLAALKGQTVRLRVRLKDADLFALRFAD
ncbi:hypothetical protein [Horticoccus sp. 23ND18S-11]|uniref:hypothetical protein n=1 Tax=Horticoccus sp. 23ND18S-11 TaxID=3391832 RepID=UPI0039C9E3DD